MLLYNTLGRKKMEFRPVRPDKTYMYVCGITAYDYCHIGHARSAVVFDVLARRMRHLGFNLFFVRNFTDIDDKIMARAAKEGSDWQVIAQTYIDAFHEDMDRLGVLRPDSEPRATEYIPQIQELCLRLIDAGKAYVAPSGDVYFRVRSYLPYGKLSGRTLDDLLAGARVAPGEEKEDPLDFAVWKASKPGEPFWNSPWGKGRPGWHIECSAMSAPYLPLDIHGGGQDLVFPHHENEAAQTESVCGHNLASYWIHNGFVQINAEKMSKSLGNFKTIRQILQNYLPETLRFFLLSKHYRSPIDFTAQGLDNAEKALYRMYSSLLEAHRALAGTQREKTALPDNLRDEWRALHQAFNDALDDDINTALALGHVFSQARIVNRLFENKHLRVSEAAGSIFEEFLQRALDWNTQLGLFGVNPHDFLNELRALRAKRAKLDIAEVEATLQERRRAREQKDFEKSDRLRNRLHVLGVSVQDTPEGQIWDIQ
ncbi:MAG: Zn-dependent M48 family peptidase [Candidatus Desulfovibrio kirbyi]|uniref:Cysteine--tRNA ligase n=1 Tax=Candidatus Desulfovibrio kirbyi TaxID=2696086 RepID=A0A6L2R4A7_9BACT|nr:MAG: Zn-dependent M48 family peptidase [Candidatus Desulfovibrio kirbyi]